MNAGTIRGGEILRGMCVESAPVRVGRGMRTGAAIDAPSGSPDPQELATRQGYEEGLQLGRTEGMSAGREEGLHKGRAEAAAQVACAVREAVAAAIEPLHQREAEMRAMLRALSDAMEPCRAVAEDDMVDLCFATICRVLGELAVRPETVRLHLAYLLSLLAARRTAVLHVHPQDAALLEQTAFAAGPIQAGGMATWVPDPQVELGGCIVNAGSNSLDGRLETTVESLKAALLDARARRSVFVEDGA
jgi:flagellar assembly protein FliH